MNINREQMVTMLHRYSGSAAATGDLNAFQDAASVSGYAVDAMIWAVQNGIIGGVSADTLAPQAPASRAQLAAVLHRFAEKNA